MQQFEVNPIVALKLGSYDISFTNSALFMVLSAALITVFLVYSTRGRALVPGRWQSMAEMSYEMVANLLRDNVGSAGRQYFPFVFTLFMFILFGNIIGLVPGTFTFTSHIAVTFAMAIIIFLAVTVIGFVRHGAGFLRLFFPHGAPLWTAVILIPIELVSYLSRPISLSVRLFANMVVGHVLLKVLGGFVVMLGLFGVFVLPVLVSIQALELLVGALQAYVFTILTCIYLHDAIHLH
ncbi:F0F1 ATP synthase subunit A [Kiloniella laminariae]|uniref:ATP synthase subunit a n=1 Tax=Kiloniella laminariae TaxID=454162 RepID=A0ABT4LLJ2_9PROT|nr:F0F1 ATP synthase subunit A [Kiloniella laminariae]MCZ4281805.1 F0F1 ATP synthase subunit A [Kiloniella laminariae]